MVSHVDKDLLDKFEILRELQMFNQSCRDPICQLPFWVL